MEINWLVVLIRLFDGVLYGTGFALAIMFWVWVFK
jgi:hypothetical protein